MVLAPEQKPTRDSHNRALVGTSDTDVSAGVSVLPAAIFRSVAAGIDHRDAGWDPSGQFYGCAVFDGSAMGSAC